MKTIFYRYLLKNAEKLMPNEKILYSFLVSKSLTQTKWAFNEKDGKLDKEALSYFFNNFGNWIPMCNISKAQMSKELCVGINTITRNFSNLEKYYFIRFDGTCWRVFVNWTLLNGGYIELRHLDKLKGDLAIFYAYIADKGSRYNYSIDTWKTKMAEDLGKTTIAITKLLNRLYRLNLAKRLPNGRLQVAPPEKEKSEGQCEPTPAANILRPNKVQNVTSGRTSRHLYGRLIQPLPNHNW